MYFIFGNNCIIWNDWIYTLLQVSWAWIFLSVLIFDYFVYGYSQCIPSN